MKLKSLIVAGAIMLVSATGALAAKKYLHSVIGSGGTDTFRFRVEVTEQANRGVRGKLIAKPLSADDEIENLKLTVNNVDWDQDWALLTGESIINYRDGREVKDADVKALIIDRPESDIVAIVNCDQNNSCTMIWHPWTVVSGDVVVDY